MVMLIWPIDVLELSAEASDFLRSNTIYFVGDLEQRTRRELLDMPHASAELVLEIDLALRKNGRILGTRLEDWPPKVNR